LSGGLHGRGRPQCILTPRESQRKKRKALHRAQGKNDRPNPARKKKAGNSQRMRSIYMRSLGERWRRGKKAPKKARPTDQIDVKESNKPESSLRQTRRRRSKEGRNYVRKKRARERTRQKLKGETSPRGNQTQTERRKERAPRSGRSA